MFKEGESRGGADNIEGNTINTSRWQKGRGGGVHDTHAPIVPDIERERKARASLPFEQ